MRINMSNLATGMYVFQIKTQESSASSFKIIKQ